MKGVAGDQAIHQLSIEAVDQQSKTKMKSKI
jgi:hypothetical protein